MVNISIDIFAIISELDLSKLLKMLNEVALIPIIAIKSLSYMFSAFLIHSLLFSGSTVIHEINKTSKLRYLTAYEFYVFNFYLLVSCWVSYYV